VKSLPSMEMVPVRAVAVWLLMSSVAETFFVMNRNSVALIFPVQCPTRSVERVTGIVGEVVGVETVEPVDEPGGFATGCVGVADGAVTGGNRSGAERTGMITVTSSADDDSTRRGSSDSTEAGTYDMANTFG